MFKTLESKDLVSFVHHTLRYLKQEVELPPETIVQLNLLRKTLESACHADQNKYCRAQKLVALKILADNI